MTTLLAFPILGILLVLQSAIFSQIPLLQGTTDLVLLALVAWSLQRRVRTAWQWGIIGGLLVGFVSAVPFFVYYCRISIGSRLFSPSTPTHLASPSSGNVHRHVLRYTGYPAGYSGSLAGVWNGAANRRLDQLDHPAQYFIEFTFGAAILYIIQRSGELPVS